MDENNPKHKQKNLTKKEKKKKKKRKNKDKKSSLLIGNINIQQKITLVTLNNKWILSHLQPCYIMDNGLFQKKTTQGVLRTCNFQGYQRNGM